MYIDQSQPDALRGSLNTNFGISKAAELTMSLQLPLLTKLFSPRSIALIGASENPAAVGREVVANLIQGGYTGNLFLVNPKYAGQETSAGDGKPPLRYFASVAELPDGVIDMAIVMTPNKTVPTIMDQLGNKGIKSAVLISAGFKEIGGEGLKLEEQLREVLQRQGMVMIGPNCLGVANSASQIQMNATFAKRSPMSGSGALVSQSGGVGVDIVERASRLGLGLAYFASVGNSMQIGADKLMKFWATDPNVKYIVGYLEAVPDPEIFAVTAAELTKTKPILMIKAGKTSAGARAAGSHTGSLAGSDSAVEALFAQTGIQRMDSIQHLFAAAQAFEYTKPSVGNRVAVFSNAGGYAVMATDLIEPTDALELKKQGLKVAQLSPQTEEDLKSLLPAAASRKNPIDTTATAPVDDLQKFKQALLRVLEDPQVDSCIVAVVPVMSIKAESILKVVAEAQMQSHKPVVAMLSTSEQEVQLVQKSFKEGGISPVAFYTCVEDAVVALGALEKQRVWAAKPVVAETHYTDVNVGAVRAIVDRVRTENRNLLTTTESLDVLKAYGIEVPAYRLTSTVDEALKAAAEFGYPVVLKLSSQTISHKTEVGGVVIDIRTPEQLRSAYEEMEKNLKARGIGNFQPGEGLMVQQFLTKGREVILGVNDDPQFGKVMMLGLGGIYVEVFKDVQFRLHPISSADVGEMLEGLRSINILKGYRGKPGVDLEALTDVVLRLSQLVKDFPEIAELDINPYMAQPKPDGGGKGGKAVDSRIILKPGA